MARWRVSCWQIFFWGLAALVFAPAMAMPAEETKPPAEPAASSDCVLTLAVPEGTKVSIDGEDYGQRRKFEYESLDPAARFQIQLGLQLPNGDRQVHTVLLRRGWQITLAASPPRADWIEPMPQVGLPGGPESAQFSQDGKRILFRNYGMAVLYDKATGRQLRRFEQAQALALSPTGLQVAAGDDQGDLVLWDATGGNKTLALRGHGSSVNAIAYSADSTRVLSGGADNRAVLWDAASGQQLQIFSAPKSVQCVAVRGDAAIAATGIYGNAVILWDVASGRRLRSLSFPDNPRTVAFSPDGKCLLATSIAYAEGKTSTQWTVWDVESGQTLGSGRKEDVHCVAFSPDGKQLLLGGGQYSKGEKKARGTVVLWDYVQGKQTAALPETAFVMRGLAFSPDGGELLLLGEKSLRWDWKQSKALGDLADLHRLDSRIYATAPMGTTFYFMPAVLDLATGKASKFLDEKKATHAVATPDGKRIVFAVNDYDAKKSSLVVFDRAAATQLKTIESVPHPVATLQPSQHGDYMLTSTWESKDSLCVWDVASGAKKAEFTGGSSPRWCFSGDGRRVAFFESDETVAVWETDHSQKHASMGAKNVNRLALNLDGTRLAVVNGWGADAAVDILDVSTQSVLQRLPGAPSYANGMLFSADGQMLAIGDSRKLVVWDPVTGRLLRTIEHQAGYFSSLGFTDPAGRLLYIVGNGGRLHLWDMATGQEVVRLLRLYNSADWLAMTPEGLVDGSPAALDLAAVRIGGGSEVAAPRGLAETIRRPGLLAEIFRGRRPLPAGDIAKSKAPEVKIVDARPEDPKNPQRLIVEVEVADRGGGVKGPWLRCNLDRIEPTATEKKGRFRFALELAGGENRLEAHAASADEAWPSRPALLARRYDKPAAPITSREEKPELVLQTGHSGKVGFAAWSPDGRLLATGGEDHAAILWDAETGQQIHTLVGHAGNVTCGRFSDDGSLLLTGGYDHLAILWDVATGRRLRVLTHRQYSLKAVGFESQSHSPLTATEDEACVWDPSVARLVRAFSYGANKIIDLAFSPDGSRLLTAVDKPSEPHALLWDTQAGKQLLTYPGESSNYTSVGFTADGKLALTTRREKPTQAILWNTDQPQQVSALQSEYYLWKSTFAPGGQLAATAESDEVILWDPRSGQATGKLSGFDGSVSVVALSPDGRRLFATGYDQPCVVADAQTGRWLAKWREEEDGKAKTVHEARFSPDGKRLLLIVEGKIVVRDGQSGSELMRFQPETFGGVDFAVYSPDGTRIYSPAKEGVGVFEASSGNQLQTIPTRGFPETCAISRSGDRLLIGGWEGTDAGNVGRAGIYDAHSGGLLHDLAGHGIGIKKVAFSLDGRLALTASSAYQKDAENKAILWDVASGRMLRSFERGGQGIKDVAFSTDGRRVLLLDEFGDESLGEWDAENGNPVRMYRVPLNGISAFAVSPDGRHILAGAYKRVILWDAQRSIELDSFQSHDSGVDGMAFSPDGKRLLSVSDVALVWDTQRAAPVARLHSHVGPVSTLAFTPDGSKLATAATGFGNNIALWDLASGQMLRVFGGHGDTIKALKFSPDGRYLAALIDDDLVVQWTIEGTTWRIYRFDGKSVYDMAFTPDGNRIAVVGGRYDEPGVIRFYETASGQERENRSGHKKQVLSVAFSSDGRQMITGAYDKSVIIWETSSGRELFQMEVKDAIGEPKWVAFSPDGREAMAKYFAKVYFWDTLRGNKLREVDDCYRAALSSDGRQLLGSYGELATLFDAKAAKPLKTLPGHTGEINGVAISPSGRHLATGANDGTARLWDAQSGEELVRLVTIDGGADWLATTPDGLFDGSPGGRRLVAIRVPGQARPVPIDRFFNDFYRGGLLASMVGGENLKAAVKLGQTLPPALRILSPKPGKVESSEVSIEVEALDQGGGVAGLSIYQNGARVLAGGATRREGSSVRRTFQVGLVEGRNRFRITATSNDGSWEAEPAEIEVVFEEPLAKSDLYVAAVGVNNYAEAAMRLSFAAPDARTLAELFRRRGKSLYKEVHVAELTDQQATREAIKTTLKEVAGKTRKQDTLMVFFAGHGTMVGQRYYFIPHEFHKVAASIEEDIRKQGLPADEIVESVSAAAALKRVLILDTCSSGGALGLALRGRSGLSLRGAVERLSRASGVFTIAAAAASEEAQEAKQLGHGVLTYSLLAGLKAVDEGPLAGKYAQPAGPDQVVDVMEWFTFAAGQVPRLTQSLYGTGQDVQTSTQGASFPVLPLEE